MRKIESSIFVGIVALLITICAVSFARAAGGTYDTGIYNFPTILGIGSTTPYASLSVTGTGGQTNPLFSVSSSSGAVLFSVLPTGQMINNSVLPTVATSTGAGTGSVPVTIQGNSEFIHLVIKTGTSPSASATIATITTPSSCTTQTMPILAAANSLSTILSGASNVTASSTAVNKFTLTSGTVALVTATTYMWNIYIGCY